MVEKEFLQPTLTDPREMAVFATVTEHDQQAWLHFLHDSQQKESLGIGPAYTFDQFQHGKAPHLPGLLPIVDDIARNGFREKPLVSNFEESVVLPYWETTVTIEPLVTAFHATRKVVEQARKQGPLAMVLPHASLASPYAVARSLIAAHGEEIAENLHIVIGPRPAVIQFEAYSQREKTIKQIPPVLFGRALGNVILTGPDTDSTRNNPELHEWLKNLRRNFWSQMDELCEPRTDGENAIIIYCPAGRVAKEIKRNSLREYRVDGAMNYLTKYPKLSVLPVGIFDRLLSDPENPESIVMIHPDIHVWHPRNDNEAQFLHERAVELSRSPVGIVEIETAGAQRLRLAQQKIKNYIDKKASSPYLNE